MLAHIQVRDYKGDSTKYILVASSEPEARSGHSPGGSERRRMSAYASAEKGDLNASRFRMRLLKSYIVADTIY